MTKSRLRWRQRDLALLFGSVAAMDAPTIEMLAVSSLNDLNAATRFSGLPLPAAGNAIGVTLKYSRLDDRIAGAHRICAHIPGARSLAFRRSSRGFRGRSGLFALDICIPRGCAAMANCIADDRTDRSRCEL